MGQLWNINLDDYLLAVELARKNGKKAGDSIEEEFLFVMKFKKIEPICETDMTKKELLGDFKNKGLKVIDFEDLMKKYQEYKDKGKTDEDK